MKKIIRKTGEIIEVISYSGDTQRNEKDRVNYINDIGEEKSANLNYYWDLADVEENDHCVSYWEDFRNKSALKIFGRSLSGCFSEEDVKIAMNLSIRYANQLTKMLMEDNKKIEQE